MKESENIDMAKAYVALSNAHRIELIVPMFVDNATYQSSSVGKFEGRGAIREMMENFFARFPDVRWAVPEYRCIGERAVEFEFIMTSTELSTGDSIESKGVERIEFTDSGHISRVEVERE